MPSPHCFRPGVLVVLLATALVRLAAQPVEVVPDPARALSLNGTWQFAYRAGPASDDAPAAFAPIRVPGHWELQGFAEPKYGKDLVEGTGWYRRTFRVPAAWRGSRVMLRFDGVLFGFTARVNGSPVGSWASGYNPATFDVTDRIHWDADNELAVDVTTRSHGWEFDTNDCWSLSGIYRDVTLFAVPDSHLERFEVNTELHAEGSATLTVSTLTCWGEGEVPAKISGRLLGPDGDPVADLRFNHDKPTVGWARVAITHPQLWTAETPSLYTLELSLSSGQTITRRIGLREVKVVDGVLQLNGRPIKLRGVNHHDLWPDTGRATDEAKIRRDLDLIRAANCNFVRTSHYPPHPRLLELCDELGLYVMDEVPFGFGEEHLADEAYRGDLLTRAEATVRRDAHHPSIILWSVGNENQNTSLTIATARRVKELDPTRPVCFPQIGSYFAKSYGELPADIDVYAPHYPTTATVQDYATKLTRPVIFTEYAHALGLATDQVQAQWAIMQASPRLAGGSIWMFQDQGIRRTAKPGETPASTHDLGLNVWPDAQHYYDSHGNQGMDGLVYSDRTPQPDYWQVRKVYSPVQIATRELKLPAGPSTLSIPVANRFDFRSLAGCTLEWSLVANGRSLQTGAVPLQAPAQATETVRIPVAVPPPTMGTPGWLELRCRDEHGTSFYERSVRLQPVEGPTPAARADWGFLPSPPTVEETPDNITIAPAHFRLVISRATGEATLRDPQGNELASGFLPHAGRRLTEGEFVRAKKENPWTGALLAPAVPPTITVEHRDDDVTVTIRGRYPRPGVPDEALEGSVSLRVEPTGLVTVRYGYRPVNGHGLLLEAGLGLRGAPAASEFRWLGDGPYPGYPGKDALNEFGRHQLNRADLNFSGNRRNVEMAALFAPAGPGVLVFFGAPADLAVENDTPGVVLSANAIIAGRGTKFVGPDVYPNAEASPDIHGEFFLLPLPSTWPKGALNFLGRPDPAQPFQPYFHSYDQ